MALAPVSNLGSEQLHAPAPLASDLAQLAVGYQASAQPKLTQPEQERFRAFQSNLLSLLNHELRTPLMNILNPLALIESPHSPKDQELLQTARLNAQKLKRALESLLDLASIESGLFHARLRELDLDRFLVRAVEGAHGEIKELGMDIVLAAKSDASVLGDPIKLTRVFEMLAWCVATHTVPGTRLQVSGTSTGWQIAAELDPAKTRAWKESWMHSITGFEAGVMSPGSAFAGTVGSERAFLTREQEGLGSELLLSMEVLRLHGGRLGAELRGHTLILQVTLPELATESGLKLALGSRLARVGTEQGSLALVIVDLPQGKKSVEDFRRELKSALFRASDSAYVLTATSVALLLDDCRAEDAPKFLLRLGQTLGLKLGFGIACAPRDGFEAARLIAIAQEALTQK